MAKKTPAKKTTTAKKPKLKDLPAKKGPKGGSLSFGAGAALGYGGKL